MGKDVLITLAGRRVLDQAQGPAGGQAEPPGSAHAGGLGRGLLTARSWPLHCRIAESAEPLQRRSLVPRRSRDERSGPVLWFFQNSGSSENSAPTPDMPPPSGCRAAGERVWAASAYPLRAVLLRPNGTRPEKLRRWGNPVISPFSVWVWPLPAPPPAEQPFTPRDHAAYWLD